LLALLIKCNQIHAANGPIASFFTIPHTIISLWSMIFNIILISPGPYHIPVFGWLAGRSTVLRIIPATSPI